MSAPCTDLAAGADPVVGRFLEYSIPTTQIGASLEFYEKPGFSQAPVGEAWPHPYAVVTDGRIHLGLHGAPHAVPALTFVRPRLLEHAATLERLGLELELRRLGTEVFNEIGWRDPSGNWVRILEARTFSPTTRPATRISLCGYFAELALPAAELTAAHQHWERLGFVGLDELDAPMPHIACTSDTIDVGLYPPSSLAPLAQPSRAMRPALVFDAADLELTLSRLAAVGIPGAMPAARPAPANAAAAWIMAPEGTALLLRA